MGLFENLLLVLIDNRTVLRDEIGNEAGVFRRENLQKSVLQILCRQLDKLLIRAVCLPQQRLHARKRGVICRLLDFLDTREQIRLGLDAVDQLGAEFAFDQNTHIVARHAQNLLDDGNGADGVEIVLLRVVDTQILLRGQENTLIGTHCLLHRFGGFEPADIEMRDDAREHHKSPQRQHRQAGKRFVFTHVVTLLSGRVLCR